VRLLVAQSTSNQFRLNTSYIINLGSRLLSPHRTLALLSPHPRRLPSWTLLQATQRVCRSSGLPQSIFEACLKGTFPLSRSSPRSPSSPPHPRLFSLDLEDRCCRTIALFSPVPSTTTNVTWCLSVGHDLAPLDSLLSISSYLRR
jgi:hypothetical protein